MMDGNAIWKPGIGEIAKASWGIAPEPLKGGLERHIWTPSCKDVRWVMTYSHKTQSFMKHGLEKCLDKALYYCIVRLTLHWKTSL